MKLRQKAFQSVSYLLYWLQAMNEHSLHAPFVYRLYTEAIKNDFPAPPFEEIEEIRRNLLHQKKTIRIKDLGAGSSISGQRYRSIQKIARNSLTQAGFSRILYRLSRYMGAKTVVELGTSLGINTLYLSAANPEGTVYTMEGCPQTALIAKGVFSQWQKGNIHLLEGNIDSLLPEFLRGLPTGLDAAYLDANHTYTATLNYFQQLLPYLHENSFLVIDDIYWSAGMKKAWEEISRHPKVSLSIDLYDAGLLFFRSGTPKCHFILEC